MISIIALVMVLSVDNAKPAIEPSQNAQFLPGEFRYDRVFVTPRATDGSMLVFFTDTGGGWNAIRASAADRLGLASTGSAQADEGSYDTVRFPEFQQGHSILPPIQEPWLQGGLVKLEDRQLSEDGVLGSRWFAGRIWEFDYGARTLRNLRDSKALRELDRCVALGFRSEQQGRPELYFPRITIAVDGKKIEMLLDTGATAVLAEKSAKEYGVSAGTAVATSFITRSIFDGWVVKHPEWKVIDAAESGTNYPMIRVPATAIAGLSTGPVWFTQRPDANFHQWMSQMTDKPIEGAIGGSAFRYFRMVLDYPGARACFWKLDSADHE